MGLITDPLPTIGQPNATEDVDILNLLTSIRNLVNGNLDQENLLGALKDKLGVSDSGVIRRGKSIIATEESRTNVAYGLLPTPDRVQNVVLPTDGLIIVAFTCLMKSSVAAAGRAALFIGSNQLVVISSSGANITDDAVAPTTANRYGMVATTQSGLTCGDPSVQDAAFAATPQLVAADASGSGGHSIIRAAAGTYDISVQFNASSGSVTVKERKLWVRTLGF